MYLYLIFSGYPLCKIQLHLQIANLPQIPVLLLLDCFIINLRVLERRCRVLYEPLFPPADHYREHFILGCEFAKCLALFQGLYVHLRLKLGIVLLSPLLHGAKLLLLTRAPVLNYESIILLYGCLFCELIILS